jgi:FkbM family methyltransferase
MIPHAQTALGRWIRMPLRLIPSGAVVPTLSGLNRGMKWRVGAHTHGCWIGSYEIAKQRAIRRLAEPGMNVLDIGANAGFYTLGFAALCGPAGRVWAFEPDPRNLENLRFHLDVNRVSNFTVIAAAVCDRAGSARFAQGPNRATGHLSGSGARDVATVALDGLLDQGVIPVPDLVKMDVEGAEASVLEGAPRILATGRTVWLVAVHGKEQLERCTDILRRSGHAVETLGAPDELVAYPPACAPSGRHGGLQ